MTIRTIANTVFIHVTDKVNLQLTTAVYLFVMLILNVVIVRLTMTKFKSVLT